MSPSKKEKLKKEKKGNKNSIKTTIMAPHYENNEVPDVYQIKKKGIPFFHNTTVNIVDDDYKEKYRVREKEKDKDKDKDKDKEKKKNEKSKNNSKDNGYIQKRSKALLLDNSGDGQKYLNLNYIYRNNMKKITKIEISKLANSNKKIDKIRKLGFGKDEIEDNLTKIKLSKINNGEIHKKIKKRPFKEIKERGIRDSYLSSKTESHNLRLNQSAFNKSIIKNKQ